MCGSGCWGNVRESESPDAMTKRSESGDEREQGEALIITRHGRAIARIVPEAARRQEEIDSAIASIRALQKRNGKVTVEELLSARDEGRKY